MQRKLSLPLWLCPLPVSVSQQALPRTVSFCFEGLGLELSAEVRCLQEFVEVVSFLFCVVTTEQLEKQCASPQSFRQFD